jgi:hypothetical protein
MTPEMLPRKINLPADLPAAPAADTKSAAAASRGCSSLSPSAWMDCFPGRKDRKKEEKEI